MAKVVFPGQKQEPLAEESEGAIWAHQYSADKEHCALFSHPAGLRWEHGCRISTSDFQAGGF